MIVNVDWLAASRVSFSHRLGLVAPLRHYSTRFSDDQRSFSTELDCSTSAMWRNRTADLKWTNVLNLESLPPGLIVFVQQLFIDFRFWKQWILYELWLLLSMNIYRFLNAGLCRLLSPKNLRWGGVIKRLYNLVNYSNINHQIIRPIYKCRYCSQQFEERVCCPMSKI